MNNELQDVLISVANNHANKLEEMFMGCEPEKIITSEQTIYYFQSCDWEELKPYIPTFLASRHNLLYSIFVIGDTIIDTEFYGSLTTLLESLDQVKALYEG